MMLKQVNTLAAFVLAIGRLAEAQIPGAPVLQNAFTNPGLSMAVNVGAGSGQSVFGAAAGLGLGSRLQVSGAAAAQRSNDATRGVYGAKAAATLWTTSGGGFGVGAFAGVGGAPRTRAGTQVTNPAELTVPAGVTVGYRRPLGSTRGVSAYASPFYRWSRLESDSTTSAGNFRMSAGVDFSVNPSFGVTGGAEFGGGSGGGNSGSGVFGLAITWVPGRR